MLALLAVAVAPTTGAVAAPSTSDTSQGAVTLTYRYSYGQVIRQTLRQEQSLVTTAGPEGAGEAVTIGHSEARVLLVDADGSATIDEVTTYEAPPGQDEPRRDRRHYKVSARGEVLWMDILDGEHVPIPTEPLLPAKPVRPGATWPSQLKGGPRKAAYSIPLTITFGGIDGDGDDAIARLKLDGKVDTASLTTMLGQSTIDQGIVPKGCKATGETTMRLEAGADVTSRLSLECSLEINQGDGAVPMPATLHLVYQTTTEPSAQPRYACP